MLIFDKVSMQTNLECFLDCVTPVVPSHLLPKSDMVNLNSLWHPWERESLDYFSLGDLWNCYDEWSAYGAGVPITLDDGQNLVQYFVPYLSAIQIFTSNSSVNCVREETDSVSETRDFFSDSLSDESDSEKLYRGDGCSSDEGLFEQDNFWHPNDKWGNPYFQYFERNSPYERVPLMDKISSLAQKYPGLLSLRNVDLSPASWMAVAWYPIYHIPTIRTIKDSYTGFLTYHTISSSFQDMDLEDEKEWSAESKRKEGECISLPPFGMATYKMQGDLWVSNNRDQERLVSLLGVADSWLKQLKVQHHDFNYFTGFGSGKTRTNDIFSNHTTGTKY